MQPGAGVQFNFKFLPPNGGKLEKFVGGVKKEGAQEPSLSTKRVVWNRLVLMQLKWFINVEVKLPIYFRFIALLRFVLQVEVRGTRKEIPLKRI